MTYVLEDVRIERGGRCVLDLPQLTIARGAVTALVGPNGAGKSTLLRLLAFLLAPQRGRVSFAGAAVDYRPGALTALRRRVTYVASSPYLLRGTVRRNVGYGLRARRAADRGAVEAALTAVGLTALAARTARTLSGGEAQRVALARALAVAPEVVLFDEPTANVDRATLPQIEAVIERLRRDGATVVLATHDLDQAQRLGDAIVALDGGTMQTAPATTVLRGSSVRDGERWLFESGALRLEMPAGAYPNAVAIDANDVFVSRAPLDSSARNSLPGRIVAVVHDARGVLLTIDCGQPVRARITAASFTALGLAPESQVWVTFKASSVHVLREP
ncbi:MAG: ATP-binding cassette domain-containing protein [bacterium]